MFKMEEEDAATSLLRPLILIDDYFLEPTRCNGF